MRLRNTLKAFLGDINIIKEADDVVSIEWKNGNDFAHFNANLKTFHFSIFYADNNTQDTLFF